MRKYSRISIVVFFLFSGCITKKVSYYMETSLINQKLTSTRNIIDISSELYPYLGKLQIDYILKAENSLNREINLVMHIWDGKLFVTAHNFENVWLIIPAGKGKGKIKRIPFTKIAKVDRLVLIKNPQFQIRSKDGIRRFILISGDNSYILDTFKESK